MHNIGHSHAYFFLSQGKPRWSRSCRLNWEQWENSESEVALFISHTHFVIMMAALSVVTVTRSLSRSKCAVGWLNAECWMLSYSGVMSALYCSVVAMLYVVVMCLCCAVIGRASAVSKGSRGRSEQEVGQWVCFCTPASQLEETCTHFAVSDC